MSKLKKIVPALITFTIFALGAFLLFRSITFISKHINDIFLVDETKIEANTIKLDIEKFRPAAARLGMNISEE